MGDYTASAVASFAFHQRVAVLDTNVGRVLARAVANRPLGTREARELAFQLLPSRSVAQFNQAMIDLGAQYCKATPKCASCPLAQVCRWNRDGGNDPAPSSAGVSRKQSAFHGSDRQIRGRVLAQLRLQPTSSNVLDVLFADVDGVRLAHIIAGLKRMV